MTLPASGCRPLAGSLWMLGFAMTLPASGRPYPQLAVAIHVTAVAIAAGLKRHSASSRDRNVPVPQGFRHSSPPTVSFSHLALCL
ncbi:unnamed protein product [Stenotrophomonas maltophilia]|nr:unnamed protein product [Stenotrophomonas maltophilia]